MLTVRDVAFSALTVKSLQVLWCWLLQNTKHASPVHVYLKEKEEDWTSGEETLSQLD